MRKGYVSTEMLSTAISSTFLHSLMLNESRGQYSCFTTGASSADDEDDEDEEQDEADEESIVLTLDSRESNSVLTSAHPSNANAIRPVVWSR